MEHESSLTYTIDDNGIWLECECGFKKNLGFAPSVEKAEIEWKRHLEMVAFGLKEKL